VGSGWLHGRLLLLLPVLLPVLLLLLLALVLAVVVVLVLRAGCLPGVWLTLP
jgi:hypothetical protein